MLNNEHTEYVIKSQIHRANKNLARATYKITILILLEATAVHATMIVRATQLTGTLPTTCQLDRSIIYNVV